MIRFLFLITMNLIYISRSKAECKSDMSYSQYVYMAEKCICENDLALSLSYYDSAFLKTNKAVDLFNASCCALYMSNYEKAYSYLKTYFKKGARYYPDKRAFHKYYPGISSRVYDSTIKLRNEFELPHFSVSRMLDSIYVVDQYYHEKLARKEVPDSSWYYNRLNHRFLMNYIR